MDTLSNSEVLERVGEGKLQLQTIRNWKKKLGEVYTEKAVRLPWR